MIELHKITVNNVNERDEGT